MLKVHGALRHDLVLNMASSVPAWSRSEIFQRFTQEYTWHDPAAPFQAEACP
jgi:hypothetical protein